MIIVHALKYYNFLNMVCYYNITTAHTCKFPGCSNVLVLDGNMKNRRDVCLAILLNIQPYQVIQRQVAWPPHILNHDIANHTLQEHVPVMKQVQCNQAREQNFFISEFEPILAHKIRSIIDKNLNFGTNLLQHKLYIKFKLWDVTVITSIFMAS